MIRNITSLDNNVYHVRLSSALHLVTFVMCVYRGICEQCLVPGKNQNTQAIGLVMLTIGNEVYVFWEDQDSHVGHVLQLCRDADIMCALDSDSVLGNLSVGAFQEIARLRKKLTDQGTCVRRQHDGQGRRRCHVHVA